MNDYFEYVYTWITEGSRYIKIRGITIKDKIQELLDNLPFPRDEILVYRGQEYKDEKIKPESWFSTSNDLEKVLRQHIQEREECCLFKIHLYPTIKRFAVNDVVEVDNAKGFDESEIIVNGNGTFYKDPRLETKGFDEIDRTKGIRTFEAWYSLPRREPIQTNINLNAIFARNAELRKIKKKTGGSRKTRRLKRKTHKSTP